MHAWQNTTSRSSCSMCLLSRIPGLALASTEESVALRTSSGSRRKSSPLSSNQASELASFAASVVRKDVISSMARVTRSISAPGSSPDCCRYRLSTTNRSSQLLKSSRMSFMRVPCLDGKQRAANAWARDNRDVVFSDAPPPASPDFRIRSSQIQGACPRLHIRTRLPSLRAMSR